MKEFIRHGRYVLAENRITAVAFVLFTIVVLLALFGPYVAPHDPLASDSAHALQPPDAQYWFGTDQLGRDLLSRIIVATRVDMGIAVASVSLALVVGTAMGLVAGYFGGWADRIIGRLTDTIMAFPLFVLAMGIVAALGNTIANIIYATAIIGLPLYSRLARAETNVRRNAGYIEAARLAGNSEFGILLRHILPNILPLLVVQTSLTLGYTMLNVAGLSFIGLGVRPPAAEWGIMVADDGLRDIVDPRSRT